MNSPPEELTANIPACHLATVVGWWNSLGGQEQSALEDFLSAQGLSIHISDTHEFTETVSTESDDWQKVWEEEWEPDFQEYLTAHPEINFLTMTTRIGS